MGEEEGWKMLPSVWDDGNTQVEAKNLSSTKMKAKDLLKWTSDWLIDWYLYAYVLYLGVMTGANSDDSGGKTFIMKNHSLYLLYFLLLLMFSDLIHTFSLSPFSFSSYSDPFPIAGHVAQYLPN